MKTIHNSSKGSQHRKQNSISREHSKRADSIERRKRRDRNTITLKSTTSSLSSSRSAHKKQERKRSISKKVNKENINNSKKRKKTTVKGADQSLAQRLLTDITEKYKNINVQNSCYINKIEKKTMIHEINTLASALIKNEKKLAKVQGNEKKKSKEFRKIIKLQDQDYRLLEKENSEL